MFPGWYRDLEEMSPQARAKLIDVVLDNISRFGTQNDSVNSACSELVRALKRDFDFVGFSPSVMYLKHKGDRDDLDATFVHPWAMVTLIFKHRKLPMLIHVNAGMKKDKMILASIPFNHEVFEGIAARGITG